MENPTAHPESRRVSAFDIVASQPWAITPDMLQTISAIARRENDSVESVEARLGRPLQNARKATLRDSVALIPVTGPVFRYANLMTDISGATSLDALAKDLATANDDPAVSSIVLTIDSPGGQANGIAEFAQMVRASAKPVTAYVGGNAASAAYWIASAASEIVIAKTGMVGSIGAVLSIDPDRSKSGPIEIVSSQSPNKRPDVNTEAGRAQIQQMVDALAQVFVDDVAAYRGTSPDTVLSDFGQGAMSIGAAAVSSGMADRIGTLEELIAALAANPAKAKAKAPPKAKGATAMTLEELRAAHPDLCAALLAEGQELGASAERERILSVESQSLPGHDALIAQLKADGKTTGPEAAAQVLAAERGKLSAMATRLQSDAPAPLAFAAAPAEEASATDLSRPVEERAKTQWEASAELRKEFGSLGAYTAYLKNTEAGRARVLGKQ